LSDAERLEEALIELELSSQQLRADPKGSSWLPAELRELVERDDACRLALREFVEFELGLFDEGRGPSDALFTARVMRALPEVEQADARRRTFILAGAHALALGVAYLLLWPLYQSGALQPWVSNAQGWLDTGTEAVGVAGFAGVFALTAVVAMLVLLPRLTSGQLGREA
jgi:hypothetical protein